MATIPKLRVPLRLENGRLAQVPQDSLDNVAACVYAILSTERGSRLEDPEFGIVDPTFEQLPLDLSEWLEQIARYEPRAEVETGQDIIDLLARVGVKVGVRS
jgi:phage baseplate assembly protein W